MASCRPRSAWRLELVLRPRTLRPRRQLPLHAGWAFDEHLNESVDDVDEPPPSPQQGMEYVTRSERPVRSERLCVRWPSHVCSPASRGV